MHLTGSFTRPDQILSALGRLRSTYPVRRPSVLLVQFAADNIELLDHLKQAGHGLVCRTNSAWILSSSESSTPTEQRDTFTFTCSLQCNLSSVCSPLRRIRGYQVSGRVGFLLFKRSSPTGASVIQFKQGAARSWRNHKPSTAN